MRVLGTLLLVGTLVSVRVGNLTAQTAATARPTFTLSGVVIDDKRNLIPSAEVTVSQQGRKVAIVRTDALGAFTVQEVGQGTTDLHARRLGYRATTTNLDLDNSIRIEIMLEPLALSVAPVIIESGSKLSRFYEHRSKGSIGVFFDQAQIEKRHVRFSSELFRTVPGASVRTSSRYGNLVRFHGCKPRIWLDGVPLLDAELDEVLAPQDIAGIEIYSASPAVPAQYMDTRGCGTIVVWTRV